MFTLRNTFKPPKIKRLRPAFAAAFYGLTLLVSLFAGTMHAFAAPGNKYALYFPPTDAYKGQVIASFRDTGGDIGAGTSSVLSKSYIIIKDGKLGTQFLKYDSKSSEENNLPEYKLDYYCTPTQNYGWTVDKPGDDIPYVRYTMGVSLTDNKDWDKIPGEKDYDTYVGVLGNENVGSLHFPQVIDTKNGNYPAKDFPIKGEEGDNDIRQKTSVSGIDLNDNFRTDDVHSNLIYSFDNYDVNAPIKDGKKLYGYGLINDILDKCMPSPDKHVDNRAINLGKAPQGVQDEWDQAVKTAGLGENVAAAVSAQDDTSGSETPSLSCNAGLNPLNWLVCGVVTGLVAIIGDVDNLITSQMTVGTEGQSDDPNQIFCNSDSKGDAKKSCQAYHAAWSSFRDIALGLLVVAGLIVLVSQAIGAEILDAYTIRKVLPRILIAALGITLSWQIMQFLVQLTNDLGLGVRSLIYFPFRDFTNEINLGGANDIAVSLATAGAITVMGIFGLLSFVGTAALAVFIAFLILVLRQLVIIMLIIIAPIAIILYILPNTQRMYKLWWESFSKALLMFPLIAGLIASGRVFAAVANSNDTPVNSLIAFAAYFAPYFALPLTFKFAGGALRGIGGFVNDRGRGGFDRLRKYRADKSATNLKRARAGQRWNQDFGRFGNKSWMSIGHLANRAAVNALDQDELAPYRLGKYRVPGFKRGSAKLKDEMDNAAIEQSMKGYQEIEKAGGMHYQGWRALAGDYSGFKGTTNMKDADGNYMSVQQAIQAAGFGDRAPSSLADFETLSHILRSSSDDKERLGGDDIERHAGTLATLKSHPDMAYADAQVMGAVGLAAAGRAGAGTLATTGNSISKRLGGGVAQRTLKTAQRVGSRVRPDIRDGHGVILNANTGKFESAYSEANYTSDTAVASVLSVKGSDWSGAKAEAVQEAHNTLVHVARGGTGNADDQATIRQAISQGITNPYNDAGQQKAWMEVARDAGWSDAELQQLRGRTASLGDAAIFDRPDEPGPGADAGGATPHP